MLKIFQRSLKGNYEVTSGWIPNAPIELKFEMNESEVHLSMLKYLQGHSRSLRGHYDVTFGLIQNAPIKLKYDMNGP